MAGDEVLELVADRADQRPVGAEVLGVAERIGARRARAVSSDAPAALGRRSGRLAVAARAAASRCGRSAAFISMDTVENPGLERHGAALDLSVSISDDQRRQRTAARADGAPAAAAGRP